jgi:hypothetical protein
MLAYRYPKEADMPNGIFPVPQFHPQPSHSANKRPGRALRLRTWWRRARLDEQLAHGADPATSADLSLRAGQLRSRVVRSKLANALVKALGDARSPGLEPFTAKGQRRRAEILECADELLALALRLRDERAIDVRGAALTARLLNEGATALDQYGDQDLGQAVRTARLALDTTTAAAAELPTAA